MRDVQVSIASYCRASAGFVDAETLATPARTAAAFVQVLNDLFSNEFSQRAAYRSMFHAPPDPRTGLIDAFRYVRHVGQHVLHPVTPDPSQVVGGLGLGFRTFARWADVPPTVNARLWPATQALKPQYDAHLRGSEVVQTLLDAARFFWEMCPDVVDRRPDGEWTGFPLRHQPGVAARLHPEEPEDREAAVRWLQSRRPGGDLRVICGCLHELSGAVVFGLTFRGRCALTPFFETPQQVQADLALGFRYYDADVGTNTFVNDVIPDAGGVFPPTLCSADALERWIGEPVSSTRINAEWSNVASVDDWRALLALEGVPNAQAFLTLRERRLCAWFPLP